MRFIDLQTKLPANVFTTLDVVKQFPSEVERSITIQLSRFVKQGYIKSVKRGIYCFNEKKIDQLSLSNILYTPSYVSLETALHYYGMIPDVPQTVTAVTVTTTKTIRSAFGSYFYYRVKPVLYFGYTSVQLNAHETLNIASKEKALLDYFYIRKITSLLDLRLNTKELNKVYYTSYSSFYPDWVKQITI